MTVHSAPSPIRLAAREASSKADRMGDLANHQQAKVKILGARLEAELALAVQQCYWHVFYPLRNRLSESGGDLAYTVNDTPSLSDARTSDGADPLTKRRRPRFGAVVHRGPDSPFSPTSAGGSSGDPNAYGFNPVIGLELWEACKLVYLTM